jgi:hypothetical protein
MLSGHGKVVALSVLFSYHVMYDKAGAFQAHQQGNLIMVLDSHNILVPPRSNLVGLKLAAQNITLSSPPIILVRDTMGSHGC